MATTDLSLEKQFAAELKRLEHSPVAELESVLLDVIVVTWAEMQRQDISRAELADKLGVSRAYVTKLLSGNENLTLKTLVRVANALEMKVDLRLRPRDAAAKRVPSAKRSAAKQPTRRKAAAAPKRRAVAARSHAGRSRSK